MNKYILFRNKGYAEALAKKTGADAKNGVRTDEDDLKRIIPMDNDILIIDAHYGEIMSDFYGLKIVADMQQKYSDRNKKAKFIILSWYSIERFEEPDLKYQKEQLCLRYKVDFIQLPIVDFSLLS